VVNKPPMKKTFRYLMI